MFRAVVRNTGKWNGIEIVLKGINKGTIALTMDMRIEVKQLKDLRHPNIVNFVGASLEFPNVCLLMELAPKGSLDDLVSNESINIDWNFKYSLLKVTDTQLCLSVCLSVCLSSCLFYCDGSTYMRQLTIYTWPLKSGT